MCARKTEANTPDGLAPFEDQFLEDFEKSVRTRVGQTMNQMVADGIINAYRRAHARGLTDAMESVERIDFGRREGIYGQVSAGAVIGMILSSILMRVKRCTNTKPV